MKTLVRILALGLLVGLAMFVIVSNWTASQPPHPETTEKFALPPLPAGVAELKFSEFFVSPVGPLGLTLTDKLAGLEGKRVRMLGYMVRQEHGLPGQFLFAAIPVQLHDHDSALADDLPAAVVHVSVPTCRDTEVPFAPGLMLLTGTLNVGAREEADGRMSLVRLALDPPPTGSKAELPGARKDGQQFLARSHFQ